MTCKKYGLACALCALVIFALSCGGGGGSAASSNNTGGNQAAQNTATVSVNSGISTQFAYTNGAFVSVTVCVPGSTSNCMTVPNVLLDTGSTGLRLLSSTVNQLGLKNVTSGGQTLVNCVQYLDNSYNWGPVATADLQVAGEASHSVPIQIIEEPSDVFPAAPASCGGMATNTVDLLGANGILGVSFYQQDCGAACTPGAASNGGGYYSCNSSTCSLTTASLSQQLQNPVGMFSGDNNGLVVTLPSVGSGGVVSTSGTVTFGVGTQSDNALGTAGVLVPDAYGNFSTTFKSTTTNTAFIDSGSSALFFLNNTTTGLPACTTYSGFYCPSSTQSLTAINKGSDGKTSTVSFSVANADNLLNSSNDVFSNLAGTGDDTTSTPAFTYFDWGLPFFFGRSVFVVLEGKSADGHTGPYWAY